MRTAKFVTPQGDQVWVNLDQIIAIRAGEVSGTSDVQTWGPTFTVAGHPWNVAKRISAAILYGSPFRKGDDQERDDAAAA